MSATPPAVTKPDPPPKPARVQTVIQFRTVDELIALARTLYVGGVTPPNVDRPEKLVPIILAGLEVGLSVMQAVACVTPPVNGRCSIFGDAGKVLVLASGQLDYQKERHDGDGDARKAVVVIKRAGQPERTFEYPLAMAKKLTSYQKQHKAKAGQWVDDPDNMLMWRARWRAWKSEFADVLMGLQGSEEADDAVTVEVAVSPPPPPAPAALPAAAPAGVAVAAEKPGPLTPAVVAGEVMVTAEQLAELKRLKGLADAGAGRKAEDAAAKGWWAGQLKAYGVESATRLTAAQAAELVTKLGVAHDPFSYPHQVPPY